MFGIDIPIQKESILVNQLILLAKSAISKAKYNGISNKGIIAVFDRELLYRKSLHDVNQWTHSGD